MKVKITLLAVLGFVTVFHSCKIDDPVVPEELPRGKIVSTEVMATWTVAQVDSILYTVEPFLATILTPIYGVKEVKIIYETIDYHGNPTFASGAFLFPNKDTIAGWPLASYQHGTIMKKTNAPSQRLGGEKIIGLYMASDGYAMSLPDYLGLGEGPGFHPYTHAKSEATATVDMLRAVKNYCAAEGIILNDQLFLVGYSQGGHATMAAVRELETLHQDEFTVTASAPMAGPYDVSGAQAEVITSDSTYPTPGYLPFILYSYNMVYEIYDDVREVIKDEWDSIIHPLMDGYTGIGEMNQLCPSVPNQILEPAVLAEFRSNPDFFMYDILADNDLYKEWIPNAPMRLFYCEGDDQVTYRNSIIAYDAFVARGATNVELYHTDPNLNHGDCALPSLLNGKGWFDTFRQ